MIADRLRSMLLAVFAVLALALSAIGLYGVLSYSVVQRTHELAIRAALGAQPASLVRLVLGDGARLASIGLALGSVAALGVARLIGTFLFGIAASDAMTWSTAILTLALVAVLACYAPARHAVRADPLDALRRQ